MQLDESGARLGRETQDSHPELFFLNHTGIGTSRS